MHNLQQYPLFNDGNAQFTTETFPLMMAMHNLQQYPPFNNVNAQFTTVPSL